MLKVFLVEDEALIREGLRDKIPWEQYGFRFAGEAADGEIALPLIRKTRPDLLITDIKMPFMDGLSLSRIVRKEFPEMKIVIISGYDDFEYAREAIHVGVDQYLLKPITRMNLRKVLQELKDKIEQDRDQKDYQIQLQNELHEYEQFSLRRFFEKILQGELSVQEIYQEAGKCSLELSAGCYNLLFLYLQEKGGKVSDQRMQRFVQKQEEVLHYFLRNPQYILFRWNINSYGVLICADAGEADALTESALSHVRKTCSQAEECMEWYVATGNPMERLSLLPQCYREVSHYSAYRFIFPGLHILSKETLEGAVSSSSQEEKSIDKVDSAKMSPDILQDFLSKGSEKEIIDFSASYLLNTAEALRSRMFRGYVILNIRFAVFSYLDSLGIEKEDYLARMGKYAENIHLEPEEVQDYMIHLLRTAIGYRDQENSSQSLRTLRRALEYMDQHYTEEDLSLSATAFSVGVSANYLSSIFSQNMERTFTGYVTEKRMEYAKKLLRSTDLSAAAIARKAGYKDSHYFSYVFKKTQKVSPKEYRNARKE